MPQPPNKRSEIRSSAALGLLSGLLLFLCDAPYALWPLAFVALGPLWLALLRAPLSRKSALAAGFCMGLAQALPLLHALDFPAYASAAFSLYYALLWALAALGMHWALRPGKSLCRLALGAAVFALTDTLDCFLLPIWGTAQSFTKTLTNAPFLAQPAALFGQTGLAFFCALFAGLLAWPQRKRALAWLAGLAALYTALCAALWVAGEADRERPPLKVAAIGWNRERVRIGEWADPERLFDEHFKPLFDEAVAQKVDLILTPEYSANLFAWQRERFLPRIAAYAKAQGVWIGLGHFDKESDTNRILVFDAQGRVAGAPYLKNHLIATLENYRGGDGGLRVVEIKGYRLGMMICQDDNYLDLARGYRALGVDAMLVPTNDWEQVKDLHFANSRMRAIENRYAILRAALTGHLAVVSAQGVTETRYDSAQNDRGLVVGELHKLKHRSPTLDPRLFPFVLLLIVGATALLRRRRRNR